jgi:hypothetical protein
MYNRPKNKTLKVGFGNNCHFKIYDTFFINYFATKNIKVITFTYRNLYIFNWFQQTIDYQFIKR